VFFSQGSSDSACRYGIMVQVRGASTPAEELAYIVQQSNSCGLVVQDAATLDKLVPFLTGDNRGSNGSPLVSHLQFVIVLWGEPSQMARDALDIRIRTFEEVLAIGNDASSFRPAALVCPLNPAVSSGRLSLNKIMLSGR
jgi:hypothetical protein